jgi:hypothetical protein
MNMKILITSNKHRHYDRVGEIVQKEPDGRWRVRIPNAEGSIITLVRDQEFKEVKQEPDPPGTPSPDGRYQADGLGCVERVSSVERDWDGPRY